jgi:site-specific DNA recombinase
MIQLQIRELEHRRHTKQEERARIITSYRKGIIGEQDLEQELAAIEQEETILQEQLNDLLGQSKSVEAQRTYLRSSENLSAELHARLDEALDWELKRQLVETLVRGLKVDTSQDRKSSRVHVVYGFAPPKPLRPSIAIGTGTGSGRR